MRKSSGYPSLRLILSQKSDTEVLMGLEEVLCESKSQGEGDQV